MTNAVIATVGLTAGLVLVIAERILAKTQRDQIDYVIRDMRRTKESFTQPVDDA